VHRPAQVLMRGVWTLLAVSLIGSAGWLGYQSSLRQGSQTLRQESNHRLDLFASVVEARLRRLEPVPATIQLNPAVLTLLREPDDRRHAAVANDYLRRLNAHLGSVAVFVLNQRGIVLASSNAEQPDDSRLGEDVSFRPYYLEALAGRGTRQFAIGTGGDEAGYFVSHPIYDGARVVGVATIKISLTPLEETWVMLGAPALVADANQVVILSSQPEWRYTSLLNLPTERRVDLQLTRTYGALRLPQFPLSVRLVVDEDSQEVQGELPEGLSAGPGSAARRTGVLVLGRSLDGMDWRVLIFSDLRAVRDQALVFGLGCGMAAAFALLIALYWAQRKRIERQKLAAKRMLERANAELEQEVSRRTLELTDANGLLRKEVSEREHAENTLRAAQDELVHAGKMAVLGQLAAGITHELTQPLGAIRTLSGNAAEFMRRSNLDAAQNNLSIVARLVDQMGRIIDPLKSFSRKSAAVPSATDVGRMVEQALFLFELRVRHEGVHVRNECTVGAFTAWCDANRLEQVLINLIANALDAMKVAEPRVLTLRAFQETPGRSQVVVNSSGGQAHNDGLAGAPDTGAASGTDPVLPHSPAHAMLRIIVQDSGSGLSPTDQQRLFEPFYTTKPSGAGLGLGLVISRDIAREFGGDLLAHNAPEGGARFELLVPADSSAPTGAPTSAPTNAPT
jgi:C4-dicarboxylate-specific signal transduction histidine kinase